MEHPNVDPTEIDKFAQLASRWWDKNSEFKPLHQINPLRVDYIDQISDVRGKKIIDIGCGGGILSEGLAQKGAQVTGIDMAEASIEVAKLHLHESKLDIDYRLSTAEDIATEQAEQYDIVCCLEMLEHVPDPQSVINACAALAKPGGKIFLSTINRNPKAYLFAILGAEYILKLLPKGTHDYEKLIKPSELASYCRNAQLRVIGGTGLTYNPLTQRYKLNDDDMSVNYMMHIEKDL